MTADSSSLADVYHSIKAVLDIFSVPAPDSVDVPSKQVLVQAAEQIKNDAAKIGLLCSGGAPPKDQQVSLATALQCSCVAFVTACHASTAAAGPSLKDSLVRLAQDTVNPCLALIKDMGSGKDLKHHVGLVWERVDCVSKAPLDNKACLFAALAKVMAVLKDTLREMEELQEEQEEQYGQPETPQSTTAAAPAAQPIKNHKAAAADSGAADDAVGSSTKQPQAAAAAASSEPKQHAQAASSSSSKVASKPPLDVDLDFEADEMSYWERQLLTASLALLEASTAVVKAFGKALLQGPGLAAGSDVLDGWESCLWHAKHLRRAVEDLGAAMYPPQDLKEVGGASLAVFEVTELMADECPDSEAVGAQQLSSLNQQLLSTHEALLKLLEQAQSHARQEQQQHGQQEQELS